MVNVEGEVVAVLFRNEENGYSVGSLMEDETGEVINFVGNMPAFTEGEQIILKGEWTFHKSYGKQLKVDYFEAKEPTTESGILLYLSSGVIKGIREGTAKKIVNKFGDKTFDVIQEEPERLLEIDGIGSKKLDMILKSYYENVGIRKIVMELGKYGLTVNKCIKIYKKFKESTVEIIKSNPYQIVEKVNGIGFRTIDNMAQNMGMESDSPDRIRQAIIFNLKIAAYNGGNTFLPEKLLVNETAKLLELDSELIVNEISAMAFEGKIHLEKLGTENIIYLMELYIAENYSCKKLVQLATYDFEQNIDISTCEKLIDFVQEEEGITLAGKQFLAVREALTSGVMVLTGGPGTGKTTTVNTIIKVFEKLDMEVVLAAPTGRAAKRISETSGREAKTIHRLLEMNFDDADSAIFMKNEDDPLFGDVLIVDEASMIDISLMYNLLKAIPEGMRFIIVGDSDQLPSVGPGNVLRDIIKSSIINVVRLDEIFRQAKQSMIVLNAHRINNGQELLLNGKDGDFFFMREYNPLKIQEIIVGLVQTRLPKFAKVDKMKGIQVLSPKRKGELGVNEMNKVLQQALNPKDPLKAEVKAGDRIFRVGDKVMQVKNNYEKVIENEFETEIGKGVYNGDIGYIMNINKQNKELHIIYDDEKIVKYSFDEFDEIEHCFVSTIHKSQGSEFPVVIIPISRGPEILYNRNLIYTAVTRAKKLVVMVGEKKYLDKMINNTNVNARYSNLDYRLMKMKDYVEK